MTQNLNESSLSRIWKHVENDDMAFGVVSAFRQEDRNGNPISPKDNLKRHRELVGLVRGQGYGYIQLEGGYEEKATGKAGVELALFIPVPLANADKLKGHILKWGKKYDQDTVIYKDNKEFVLYGTNSDTGFGRAVERFTAKAGRSNLTLSKDIISDYLYSSLTKGSHKGTRYLFTMKEALEPLSWSGALYEYYAGVATRAIVLKQWEH